MAVTKTVLTIEDEPQIRASIVAYLEDSGFSMLEAACGTDGMAIFRDAQPDAVLCDLRLPDMNGLDILAEIVAVAPETPVIIVSGASMIDDAIAALQRGAWDFVTKPILDMVVLEDALRKGLERAQLMRENREYQQRLEQVNRELSETLRQLQADEEAGREIQLRLLPENDRIIAGYRFQRQLYPSTLLSGDFVDYCSIDQDHTAFYMADVSGHGVASAFVTVMLKTLMTQYIEAYLSEGDRTLLVPDRTLQRLNRDLYRQNLDKYLTMFYGVIDHRRNTLVCCNGGQYPQPILYDGERSRALKNRNRPVGLFEDTPYIGEEIQLPREFLLLLISDGLFELMPKKSNRDCYADLQSRVTGADITFDRLIEDLDIEAQTERPDDVTLLSVTRREVGIDG